MAFSCGITKKAQPSLKLIFESIDRTKEHDPDLTRWANQGVLLLNTALTCEIDKIGSHINIWKDFIAYLIDFLNFTNRGLIFILLGKHAQELEPLIGSNHYVLKASHPNTAFYDKTYKWNCEGIWEKANKIIEENNGKEFCISW